MYYYQMLDGFAELDEDKPGHDLSQLIKYLEINRPSFLSAMILNEGFQELTHIQAIVLGMQSVLDHIRAYGLPEDLEDCSNKLISEV